MGRIADRARANELQEGDRTALAYHGAGRPVTTLPVIAHRTAASSSTDTIAKSSVQPVLKSEEFPPIDPNITDREARRKLVGDRQAQMTNQQFKGLNRSTLPPMPERRATTPAAHPKICYAHARG